MQQRENTESTKDREAMRKKINEVEIERENGGGEREREEKDRGM